jgi:hypothetical protein
MTPICTTCADTHVMWLGDDGDSRKVMCTRCPVPCQQCREGGNGAYCAVTPCPCGCHATSLADIQRHLQQRLYKTEERLAALEMEAALAVKGKRCSTWWIPGILGSPPGHPRERTRCFRRPHTTGAHAFTVAEAAALDAPVAAAESPVAVRDRDRARCHADGIVECMADQVPGSTAAVQLTPAQYVARAEAWRTWLEKVPIWSHVEQGVVEELALHLARVKRPPVGK